MNTAIKYILFITLLFMLSLSTSTTMAAENTSFYVKPILGLSIMSDKTANAVDILEQTGSTKVKLDSGINAGIAFGYLLNENVALELDWHYRSNDSQTDLPQTSFTEGNYASSLIGLNAYYLFAKQEKWQLYTGAGLVYAQEIDIDLEDNDLERSLSGSGDVGFQLTAGVNYEHSEQWSLSAEARMIRVNDISLDAEENLTTGSLTKLDYSPYGLQIGLQYRF
jgi:outer membrane protein W